MCTISVEVDEKALRNVLPELESPAAISRWVQLLIDQHIEALTKDDLQQQDMSEGLYNGLKPDFIYADDDQEAIDLETMRENLHQMINEVYAQP